MKEWKWVVLTVFVFTVMAYLTVPPVAANDAETLEQLKAIIEAQQKDIEELKRKVNELTRKEKPETAPPEAAPVSANMVKSRDDKVAVKIYGHVNRALLVADDGDDTNYYNVDNANSQSRLGIDGVAKINDHLSIGSKIELGLKSNLSGDVDQKNKNPSFDINERVLEMFITHDRLGELSIGQGHTASDGSSEVDLSGTSVIGYSFISGVAGGQLFFDKKTKSLSDTRIRHVFQNMDGLARQDRIRYDSPIYYGFRGSGSINNDDGGDLALRYSGKFGDTMVAAAGAWARSPPSSLLMDPDPRKPL